MTSLPLWLQNLTALGLQIAAVTAGAALLALAIRLRLPSARLAYWQLILLLCLGLPALQTWQQPEAAATPLAATRAVSAPQISVPSLPARQPIRLDFVALYILTGGAALRFLWFLAGLYGLRRFRRTARVLGPLDLTPPLEAAQVRLRVRADFAVSDLVLGPITFGVRRPLILLPPRVLEMEETAQHAIACHELIHVRRRDWLWTLLEELVLGIFWFHPAVWWVVGQIRLSREQVVDQEAVDRTESSARYAEALLAVAGFERPALPTPAALFLERRHLVQRVTAVLKSNSSPKESLMSKKLMLRLAAGLIAAVAVARVSILLFPLHANALLRQDLQNQARPIQVESGGEYLLHGPGIEYPEAAIKQRVEGLVQAEITTDDHGQVTDARILSGPEQLRKAVLSAVLQWHFDASKRPAGTSQVAVRFQVPPEGAELRVMPYSNEMMEHRVAEWKQKLEQARSSGNAAEAKHAEEEIASMTREVGTAGYAVTEKGGNFVFVRNDSERSAEQLHKMLAERQEQLANNSAGEPTEATLKLQRQIRELKTALAEREPSGVVSQIRTDGLAENVSQAWMGNLPVHLGDRVDSVKMEQLQKYLHSVDEHLGVRTERDPQGNMAIIIVVRE